MGKAKKDVYKVVINNCYGGFSISEKAVERLKELKKAKGWDVSEIGTHIDYDERIPRHDEDLVKVVEELGPKASGICASVKVYELVYPIYRIEEYDGLESIKYPNSDYEWKDARTKYVEKTE